MQDQTLKINGLSSDDAFRHENGFYWFGNPLRIAKLIAQYEIYKIAKNLPGSMVEFGVYKGCSLVRLATFRDMNEMVGTRKMFAFDAFGDFPVEGISEKSDREFIKNFYDEGGNGLSQNEVETILTFKSINNVQIIKGDVRETFLVFLETHKHIRFNLVHLDMDVYEPTKFILDNIYDLIVPGGVIMIDDCNTVTGATRAVDEFVKTHKGLAINKLPISHIPAYICKK